MSKQAHVIVKYNHYTYMKFPKYAYPKFIPIYLIKIA